LLHSDFGPPERRRHDPVVIEHVEEESQAIRDRARVYSRSPLKTYFRRKLIDGRQPLAVDRGTADRGRRSRRLLRQGEGRVTTLIVAGVAVAAVLFAIWMAVRRARRRGRAEAERQQMEKADEAKGRMEAVPPPDDELVYERLRDGEF
jgi:hypothetical protein